jgi:hypothetical protein
VGYARTGSQISTVPEKSHLSEEEELASASVTSCPDAGIDNNLDQVLGPSVKTSVLNSVDLTLDKDDDVEDPSSLLSQAHVTSFATSLISPVKVFVLRSSEVKLKSNIDHAKAERPKESQIRAQTWRESGLDKVLVDASVANTENDKKAVDTLSHVIKKADSATMDVSI